MTKTTNWKLLIATSDESEASFLKNRLVSEGIPCRVHTDKVYPGTVHGGRTTEIQLYVPAGDFEASQLVMENSELGEEEL